MGHTCSTFVLDLNLCKSSEADFLNLLYGVYSRFEIQKTFIVYRLNNKLFWLDTLKQLQNIYRPTYS